MNSNNEQFLITTILIQYFCIFWSFFLFSFLLLVCDLSNFLVNCFLQKLCSTFPDKDGKRSINHGQKTVILGNAKILSVSNQLTSPLLWCLQWSFPPPPHAICSRTSYQWKSEHFLLSWIYDELIQTFKCFATFSGLQLNFSMAVTTSSTSSFLTLGVTVVLITRGKLTALL